MFLLPTTPTGLLGAAADIKYLRSGNSSSSSSSSSSVSEPGFSVMDFMSNLASNTGLSFSRGTSSEAALNNRLFQQAAAQQMEYQTKSAREAMKFNQEEAQKARDWSEMMSNTAYQRAVKDLKAAGLNPILAYTNGPASTPGSTSATGYAQQGAMANVDTQDWKSMQKQARAALLSATASMTFATAKAVDSVAGLFK